MQEEQKFKQSGQRQLKVYERHFSRRYTLSVVFPEIRLCGKWLRESGFECGQAITVYTAKNKIIITVDKES